VTAPRAAAAAAGAGGAKGAKPAISTKPAPQTEAEPEAEFKVAEVDAPEFEISAEAPEWKADEDSQLGKRK
jgi:hypothetical protein